jgi:DsbC/DsbD-like thiol-disulfide interchange protein
MNPRLALPLAVALLAGVASAQTAPIKKLPPFLTDARLTATHGMKGGGTLTLTLMPLKGYHLYAPDPGDKFLTPTTIKIAPISGLKVGPPVWPAPKTLGKARVYEGPVTVTWKLTAGDKVPAFAPITITIKAQGCNESDCFPPATFTLTTTLPPAK